MKNWLLAAIFVVAVLPHYQPMFDGMIVRCDDQGKCHWECEFGVAVSTTMVNDNLVVMAAACNPKPNDPPKTSGIIYSSLQMGDTVYHLNGW